MAVFGLPGGTEFVVILTMIAVLFLPSVLFFFLGYLTGKNAGMRSAVETVAKIAPEVASEVPVSMPSGDEAASPGDPDA